MHIPAPCPGWRPWSYICSLHMDDREWKMACSQQLDPCCPLSPQFFPLIQGFHVWKTKEFKMHYAENVSIFIRNIYRYHVKFNNSFSSYQIVYYLHLKQKVTTTKNSEIIIIINQSVGQLNVFICVIFILNT